MNTTPSQRARELLAAEYRTAGLAKIASWIRSGMGDESTHTPALRAIDEAIAQGRADERRAVVEFLKEQAAWHDKHDDGLSGFDRIAQGYREAVDAIERGDHVGTGG